MRLDKAEVSKALNSFTAVATTRPNFTASSSLCACVQLNNSSESLDTETKSSFIHMFTSMLRGRTGSCRESLRRNHPPKPETRIYFFFFKRDEKIYTTM